MNTLHAEAHLSNEDRAYIERTGRNVGKVIDQYERFITGFSPMQLVKSVTPKAGLFHIEDERVYVDIFEKKAPHRQLCKFVPASGAASRMFKLLYAYLADSTNLTQKETTHVEHFCRQIAQAAFYKDLKEALEKNGYKLSELIRERQYSVIIRHILTREGLSYGSMPKALLAFHQYDDHVRTALEEHLVEAVHYCQSDTGIIPLHFTVSAQHQSLIEGYLKAVIPMYEKRFRCTFHVTTSIQQASTDTPAVEMSNQPFRNENGELLFRPGGHGALLENLNRLEADWVFIKNVDNVVPDHLKAETYHWKKVIGGVLADAQEQVYRGLERLDTGGSISVELLSFMKVQLNIAFPEQFEYLSEEEQNAFVYNSLNRPIRVCGIIKTVENTGGGPFWVKNEAGKLSLQIVETAQIDLDNPNQKAIVSTSTYANITDLVCGLKDYQGKPFDLLQFRDDEAGFITPKSLNGKPLKAMELPGLWNGAMADWITILVEVPGSTFNPVKSVFDLLARGES